MSPAGSGGSSTGADRQVPVAFKQHSTRGVTASSQDNAPRSCDVRQIVRAPSTATNRPTISQSHWQSQLPPHMVRERESEREREGKSTVSRFWQLFNPQSCFFLVSNMSRTRVRVVTIQRDKHSSVRWRSTSRRRRLIVPVSNQKAITSTPRTTKRMTKRT